MRRSCWPPWALLSSSGSLGTPLESALLLLPCLVSPQLFCLVTPCGSLCVVLTDLGQCLLHYHHVSLESGSGWVCSTFAKPLRNSKVLCYFCCSCMIYRSAQLSLKLACNFPSSIGISRRIHFVSLTDGGHLHLGLKLRVLHAELLCIQQSHPSQRQEAACRLRPMVTAVPSRLAQTDYHPLHCPTDPCT